MPRQQALSLHPDFRQRLFFRVRHLQHHRLDRAHAKAAAGEEFWLAGVGVRNFPKEEVYFARGKIPPAEPSVPLQGWKLPPETHSIACWRSRRTATFQGGREWRVNSSRFPIAKTITGVVLDLDPGALAHAALASECRRVAIRHRGRGQRHPVRLARPLPDRAACRRATSAISRKATAIRSRMSAAGRADPDRLQHRHLREHRPHAMDRRQSRRRAGHQFWPDRRSWSKNFRIATCSLRARAGRK